MAIKCIISGDGGSHDTTVQTAILDNCSLVIGETEKRVESFANSIAYADSVGAEMVVRSTTGLTTFITDAETYYANGILSFVPLGSNAYAEITDPTSIPVIVTCGAGITTDGSNATAYGQGLEFWDRETYGENGTAESSYSNGVIAGKLYAIKVGRNCGWWEARYCARKTASQGGVWDKYNGYGVINVADAIAFVGTIPPDPYDETLVNGMERLSDNFKFWGQQDVTFADLTKSFAYYEATARL